MSYIVDDQRKQTMMKRIGDASEIIDDMRYLPYYRSIQIKLEKMGKAEEWLKMIEIAKTKTNPSKYFSELCKRIKAGTYKFVKKAKEIPGNTAIYLHDKLVKYGFGKYQKYWVHKSSEFINKNGMAGFVELMEFADRKGISQKYLAKALQNCKPPGKYYKENVKGGAK